MKNLLLKTLIRRARQPLALLGSLLWLGTALAAPGLRPAAAGPARVQRAQAAVSYTLQGDRGIPPLQFGARRVFIDLDTDGDPDVLYQLSNTSGGGVEVRLNSGGTFGAAISQPLGAAFTSGPLNGIFLTQVLSPNEEVVDLDNDGDQDIVEYLNTPAVPRLIRNNGNGTFTSVNISGLPVLQFAVRHLFVDMDKDGDPDILYQNGNSSGSGFAVQFNNGDNTFAAAIAAPAGGTFSSGPLSGITFTQLLQPSFQVSDLDDDGDQDIVDIQNNTTPRLLRNNGNSTYTAVNISSLPTLAFGARYILFDVESDGDPDILYQTNNTSGAGIALQLNNSDGTFAAAIAQPASSAFTSGPLTGMVFTQIITPSLSSVDYDADGDADLFDFVSTVPPRSLRQEGTRPQLSSTAPADNATGVSTSTNVVLTFDRSVSKGNGNLYLVRTSDNVVVETVAVGAANITGSGTTWTYNPTITLAGSTSYAIRTDDEIFIDVDGRAFAGIANNTTYNFTTSTPLAVSITSQTNASCNGGTNGAATATATGGSTPYSYNWAPGNPTGDGTASVTGLSAGNYSVTVTDNLGAMAVANFAITQPSALAATTAQTNVACFGGTSGTAAVSVSGGAGSYSYNWTPGNPTGDGTASVTGLSAGNYSVLITDANSCTLTKNFTISQPGSAVGGTTVVTNVSCFGGSNGTINLTPSGGTPGYTFLWNNGATTEDRTGLSAGTYLVTITDANGCTKTVNSIAVTQPPVLAVTKSSQTNIACFGSSTGAASVNPASGGTAPYTYDWTPGTPTGDGTRSVTGLTAGTWTVTVTDANGCTAAQSFIITQPPVLAATTSQTNVTTNGGSDGSATINLSGGTPSYTYSWSPSVSTTATASNLSAGPYSVTATDDNACTITRSFTITQPAAATVISATGLTPSPTATAQVSYAVTFSGSVTGVTVSNFSLTSTGAISGFSVASVAGVSGSTYTVTVNTGTGDGTLRLNVANATGISPTITNTPFTSGTTYTITKSFAASPTLSVQGTGSPSGSTDVTAFVDVVRVLSGGSPFANALQNPGFETHDPLGNGNYGYNPTGGSWTFNSRSGIAEAGSAFTPITPVPGGIAVAFVQSNVGLNGQLQQNLALPTGSSYQVSFQAAQRNCCSATLDQGLNVFLNGVFIGTIQPPNNNAYSAFTSATFGVTAPALTASITSTATNPTSTSPIPVTVTFSQSATGFTAADVSVTGGTLAGFSGSGTTYTFSVTPSGTGLVTVDVPANGALDANNTGNTAAPQLAIQYNQPVTAAPVVTTPAHVSLINDNTPTYSGTAPAGSTVTVYVDGSSIGTATATGGNFSLAQPTALSQGTHTVNATAQTSGSTVSPTSNTNGFTVDTVAPSVAITSTASSPTSTSPIPVTVTFSEFVSGFTPADVSVGNGTLSGFSGSSTSYTFNVTPTGAGTVTVNIAANVALDAAGNGNTAAPQFSITYALLVTAAPVVSAPANGALINDSTPTYSGTAPVGSTVTVYVDGSSIGTTTATGGNFSLTQPTALSQGSHTVRATAQTSGQTGSPNSNTNTFTVDTVAPTVAISSTASSPTATSPIPVTVTFSENVTGFTSAEVTVGNGTLSGFSGSGTTYTFGITPTLAGAVTVNVAANVAQDGATNGNAAASPFTITYAPAPPAALTWTGAVNTDWATAGNWNLNQVPGAITDVVIAPATNQPLVSGVQVCRSLSLNANTSLSMATSAELTATGSVALASGSALTQAATSELYIGVNLTNNGATFALDPSSEIGFGINSTQHTINGTAGLTFQILTVGERGNSGTSDQLTLAVPVAVQVMVALSHNAFVTNGTGGSFTLLSNAQGTAMVVQDANSFVSTPATVQRYISPANAGLGYRHYSAPVGNTSVGDLTTSGFTPVVNGLYNTSATPLNVTPFPTVFGYDQSRMASVTNNLDNFSKGWVSPAATTTALTPGKGYSVNIAGTQKVDFVGTLNRTDLSVNLARTSGATAADGGWQLLGNPYPAPLNYALVAPADRSNLDAAMYVFESNSAYQGSYRAYVNNIGNPILPVAQGFFTRVSAGQTAGNLTFRNSQRLTAPEATSTTFKRGAADARPLVELALQGAGTSDALHVYFEQGSTAGQDIEFDAVKLPNTTGLNLSAQAAGQELAIQGLPLPGTAQVTVPLTVQVPTTGTYTLAAAQLLNLSTTRAYLRDRQTGALVDLQFQPSYTFTLNAAFTGVRFELVFSPQRALASAGASLSAQVAVFPNPASKVAYVELPADVTRTATTAVLVDGLGRTVRTFALPAGVLTHALPLQEVATGVYTLRLTTARGPVAKKLVVE